MSGDEIRLPAELAERVGASLVEREVRSIVAAALRRREPIRVIATTVNPDAVLRSIRREVRFAARAEA